MTGGTPRLDGLGGLLPTPVWRALLAHGVPKSWRPGEVLLRQGDPGTHVLMLTNGRVKITKLEPDGTPVLLAVRFPGNILGELAVLDNTERMATVQALTSCITFVLPRERFTRLIEQFDATGVVLRHILNRYREVQGIRAELATLPGSARMVRILLRLASAVQSSPVDDPVRLDLGLSQEDLASGIGLSRAAAAAELGELRRRGLITTARRRVIICDLAGLRALAGHERSS